MVKVPWVDPDVCIGTMACVNLCPEVFQLNDEGKSEVVNSEGASEIDIQEAIDACPVSAIKWVEH